MNWKHRRHWFSGATFVLVGCLMCAEVSAQDGNANGAPEDPTLTAPGEAEATAAPAAVDVVPIASDEEISNRLKQILEATGWFDQPSVRTDEGVVFLKGSTSSKQRQEWAGNLARNTQDVVAVVNQISIAERPLWDLTPAKKEINNLTYEAIQLLPLLVLAGVLLLFTGLAAFIAAGVVRSVMARRTNNQLLTNVIARAATIPVVLIGLYLILRVAGLTQIAMTVLGGTGLIGLVIGVAFRDIAENFLASLLISIQRPFTLGDLIEVNGYQGHVQQVTTRGTLVMTLNGNHVQIPNTDMYKSVIENFTANPNRRFHFVIGIDYADSIATAQSVVMQVLKNHPAILKTPEPLVLVDALGASTVNLMVYCWVNGREHSYLKVQSAIIRQSKIAVEDAGLTMPDESREVIFPQGVPVRQIEEHPQPEKTATDRSLDSAPVATAAEGGLRSEQDEIERQAELSRPLEDGENILLEAHHVR